MKSNILVPMGEFIETYNAKTNQSLPCGTIYRSNGFSRHVRKNHPEEAESLLDSFQTVIDKPDFVGKNPNIPNSIELVKTIDNNRNVLVGIKRSTDYLYVATVHSITDKKLNGRLRGGRLHQLP